MVPVGHPSGCRKRRAAYQRAKSTDGATTMQPLQLITAEWPCLPRAQITYPFIKTLALVMVRERRIAAARRALSIVNKFPPGEYRAKHVSRIFKNLNKLRAA